MSTGENAYPLIWLVLLWALVRMHTLSSDWCYYEHWWECICSHLTGATEHWWECIRSHPTGATISTGENAYALIWLVLLWALVRMHTLSSDWSYYEHWWECIRSHLTGSTTMSRYIYNCKSNDKISKLSKIRIFLSFPLDKGRIVNRTWACNSLNK